MIAEAIGPMPGIMPSSGLAACKMPPMSAPPPVTWASEERESCSNRGRMPDVIARGVLDRSQVNQTTYAQAA